MSPASGSRDGDRSPAGPGRPAPAAQQRNLTLQAARVVQALHSDPSRARFYTELARATGMPAATVHLVLGRLEAAGWVKSAVRVTDQDDAVRHRRLYTLTPEGLADTPAALAAARGQLEAVNRDVAAGGTRPADGQPGAPAAPGAGRAGKDRGLTLQAARIVQIFADEPSRAQYLGELAERTGMAGTTVRKILGRLTAAGWLEDAVEEPASRDGRPGKPRRLYTLTPDGRAAAPAALAEARAQLAAINRGLESGGPETGAR